MIYLLIINMPKYPKSGGSKDSYNLIWWPGADGPIFPRNGN